MSRPSPPCSLATISQWAVRQRSCIILTFVLVMAVARVLRLGAARTATVFCNIVMTYGPADHEACNIRHDSAEDPREITYRTATALLLVVVVILVLARFRVVVSSNLKIRMKNLVEIVEDGTREVCVAIGLVTPLTWTSSAWGARWNKSGLKDCIMNALCQTSGHIGVFIGIAYALDLGTTPRTTPLVVGSSRPSGIQFIVNSASSAPCEKYRSSRRSLITSIIADLVVRHLQQSDEPGSWAFRGLFSVYDLVSAYQWAYYRVTSPLDPGIFDMDAYLTTPINPRALLGPSAVQSTTNTSSGRLTIYDLLSAYCYAKYPIPPIMSAVLNLHVDDGLELSVAALVFHYPELLPSTSGDSAALHRSTTVLHWLNVCIPQPDVDSAWIEELDQEQGRLVVVYGPEPPPAAVTTPHENELFLGIIRAQDLRAAFVYAYHAIRSVEVRFVCSILRVVHRNKAADFNVHIFNDRTRARLLTLVEDPPEAFRSRPAAFSRVESFASTTTEGSSDGTGTSDSDFPYTDDSDFDFGNAVDVVDLGIDLLDSDGEVEACDSDLDEMTWMLEELTVDDYPALYDWELEELVLALRALTIDDLLCLRDSELEDLLALLRTVRQDDSESLSSCDVEHLSDIERKLKTGRALLLDDERVLSPSPSLGAAIDQLLADGEALQARMASTSDKFRVLQELLGRLRSRRPNTSDLLPAIPWKDKGKGKAVTLDDDDDNEDGPSSGIPRLPGLPRGRASGRRQDQPDADTDADSDSDSAKQPPAPGVQKKRKRHRGGKRIPMAERRRRNRRTVQETLAPLRDVEFVEGPSWCPDDEKWCEGFGMW